MIKNKKKNNKVKKTDTLVTVESISPAKTVELRIGIIGSNSSYFKETHQMFLKLIQEQLIARGVHPVFIGISGGSDGFLEKPSFVSDGISQPVKQEPQSMLAHYGLPTRDMIADQIEWIAHEEHLNGWIMLPWSISSLVGMMMATVRCGVPTVFAPFYSAWSHFSILNEAHPTHKKEFYYSSFSLPVLLEVFGLALMGSFFKTFQYNKNSTAAALKTTASTESLLLNELQKDTQDFISWNTQRILDLVRQNITPKRFFSQAAFQNAIYVDRALGHSTETVLHLNAIAYEAGVPLSLAYYNESIKKLTIMADLNSSGELSLEHFVQEGGIQALLHSMHHSLHPSPTISGKNLVEIAKETSGTKSTLVKIPDLIDKNKVPPGMVVLSGNLSREGSLFRAIGVKEHWLSHMGPVKVFRSEKDAVLSIETKKIKKGDVIVLSYCGPRGSPGMPALQTLQYSLEHHKLDGEVMVLTDGRILSPGKIPCITHIAPEAAVGSTLSILQDGDVVAWNYQEQTLMARLTETEIKVRLSRWKEQIRDPKNTFLNRYSKYSSSSAYGAILI